MQYRPLGRTDMTVSAISFGAWAIGGTWGPVDDELSMRALHAAVDAGTNFVDTADVYGDGRSERLVGRLRRERRGETIYVATKAGRRLARQTPEGYRRENLTAWVERSLRNLEMDAVDLLQLHCPHPQVYDMPEVFGILDDLVAAGKIRYYGVSVETVDEALRGIRHPNVQTVQIIFNMLRLKPAEEFFGRAQARRVGILARVPLASGLLTGKLTAAILLRARRPPPVQPQRRGVRQGRDVLGRPLRRRPRGRRAAEAARAAWRHARAARAALHPRVGRRVVRHSRARRPRSRRAPTPRRRTCRRFPRRRWPRCSRSTTRSCGLSCTRAGERSLTGGRLGSRGARPRARGRRASAARPLCCSPAARRRCHAESVRRAAT